MNEFLRNGIGWVRYRMASKLVDLFFWKSGLAVEYKGLSILDLFKNDSFLSQTKKAIDFIEQHDIRRFHVLQKNIKGIFPLRRHAGFCYVDEKLCGIMFKRVCVYPESIRVPLYASMLIREAVRIRITKWIPYKARYFDQSLARRLEALCCLEAFRFTLNFSEKLHENALYLQNLILLIATEDPKVAKGTVP